MLELYLIRHSLTQGNLAKRYIGTTDEPLCPQGTALLQGMAYPAVNKVFVSPRKRCMETARLLYPDREYTSIEELAECDFGEFENKNYLELEGNPRYLQWIHSNGTLPFPGGESREEFRDRVLRGFDKAVADCAHNGCTSGALVVHGGTIMNLMETYVGPEGSFYQWHVENGRGYRVQVMERQWLEGDKRLRLLERL